MTARLLTLGFVIGLQIAGHGCAPRTNEWWSQAALRPRRPTTPPFRGGVSDRYAISYHGYSHSHIDSLCHIP